MTLELSKTSHDFSINWEIFEKIIGGISEAKLKRMSQMDLISHVYEATAMHYTLKFHEEMNLRIKYEGKVIEKVGEIADMQVLLTSLTLNEEDTKKVEEFMKGD